MSPHAVESSESDCICSCSLRSVFGMTFLPSSLQGNFDPCRNSVYDTVARLSSTPLICGFHASLLQDDLSNQVPAPVTKTFSGVVNELMRGENVASNTRADWTPLQVLQQLHENLTELLCGKCQLGMADPCKFGCGRLGLRPISKSLTRCRRDRRAAGGTRRVGVWDGRSRSLGWFL